MIEKKEESGKWEHVSCVPFSDETNQYKDYSRAARINAPLPIEELNETIEYLGNVLEDEQRKRELEQIEIEREQHNKSFIPSKYQQAFFDAMFQMIENSLGYRHIVIEAVAGSGKTTTLIEGIKRLKDVSKDLSICIVAFNKHIATEFQNKMAKMLGADHGVLASTKHSLGLRAIRQAFLRVEVDSKGYKLGDIFDEIWPVSKQALEKGLIDRKRRKENFSKRAAMRSLVSICKSVLVDAQDANAVLAVIERYNLEIDVDFINEAIEQLPNVMQKCLENTKLVDFDDMGWMPIMLKLEVEKFDVLLIDEFQDMSKGDMAFLFMCIKEDGHIVGVGDSKQSLYAFRGADPDAMANATKELNAKVLPLSVTYRCPQSHVDLAKKLVPQLEARENAPAGEVLTIDFFDLASKVQDGDMVVCRTNAPLIRPAFECIRMGKKAMIRGADIGSSLINLIKRFETDDIGSFEVSLMEYYEHEYQKLLNSAKDMQAVLLTDRVETLRFIVNECQTVSELLSKIQVLFSDTSSGVVFSSVHRAKGLEANNVYILRPDLMPHPKAKKDHEVQQEKNALYVAQTRSKDKLIFVKGGENV